MAKLNIINQNDFKRISNDKALMIIKNVKAVEVFSTEISILKAQNWFVEYETEEPYAEVLRKGKRKKVLMKDYLNNYYRRMKIKNPRTIIKEEKRKEIKAIRKEKKEEERVKNVEKMFENKTPTGFSCYFDRTNQCHTVKYKKSGQKNPKKRTFSIKKHGDEAKQKALTFLNAVKKKNDIV